MNDKTKCKGYYPTACDDCKNCDWTKTQDINKIAKIRDKRLANRLAFQRWYKKNKEKKRQILLEYYKKNKEKEKKKRLERYYKKEKNNPEYKEKQKKIYHKWYSKNSNKVIERIKNWRKKKKTNELIQF